MERMNIYKRKDGRWEGRIPMGKTENGTRKFQYFFGRTKQSVQIKMRAERIRNSNTKCDKTIEVLYHEWITKKRTSKQFIS